MGIVTKAKCKQFKIWLLILHFFPKLGVNEKIVEFETDFRKIDLFWISAATQQK